ncbi:MAG: hypothetical protein FWE19_05185 [Oscillospiraceae bacterium]|nr:hypothetical protein [Oscillospiraceae bacterium]
MVKFKRLSALILALALVLGLATVALADEEATTENGTEATAEANVAASDAEAEEETAAPAADEDDAAYIAIVAITAEVEVPVVVPVILADLIAEIHQIAGTLITVPNPLVTDLEGGTLSQPDAVRSIEAALAQAADQGALVAVANWRNPASASAGDMSTFANTAGDTPLVINADTFPALSSEADVRITFAPVLATEDILLSGTTRSVTTRIVAQIFENAFGGTASVVSLAQRCEFGMEVRVAARLDESFTADAVYFYVYDTEANTVTQFVPSFVWLDSYGFLHFTTTVGGEIIVSDVNLTPAAAPPAPAPAAPAVVAPAADEVEEDEDEAEEETEEETGEDEEA